MSKHERNGAPAAVIVRSGRKLAAMLSPVMPADGTRRVVVNAGDCNACHHRGAIYKTKGRTRYCKCDNCGNFWDFDGPLSDAVHDVALQLRENLKKFDIVSIDGDEVVLWDARSAVETVQRLEELLP